MRNTTLLLIGLLLGIGLSIVSYSFIFTSMQNTQGADSALGKNNDEAKPLYWVAPMDPNYQRDAPGKSPMGMDLVPVYEDQNGTDDSPGTVNINPAVVNNLGVRTSQVKRQALHVTIKTVGFVKYNEDTLVHIHPRVTGWIETLFVKAAGEYVKKGDPLYAVYSPELVNAQEELLLARKRGNKNLIQAARSRLDALQMPAKAVETLERKGEVQHNVIFSAPQSGFIDKLNVRQGFYVKPGINILSIGALDEVWVDAEIFERQSNLIEIGLPVSMTLEYLPGKEWLGKVDYIYPTLDATTRTLKVRLRFKNANYFLKPNMFAQVVIHKTMPETSLVIPTEAVIRTGSQNRVVLALGEGKFKSIEVELGNIVEEYAEVLNGLNENDYVVSSAQFLLDSESSIHSDFKRMEEREKEQERPTTVWTKAIVNRIMPEQNKINLDHEEIPEWDWPIMTMDFGLADGIDILKLKEDMDIHIQIMQTGSGEYVITTIHIVDENGEMQMMDHMQDMNDMPNMPTQEENPHAHHTNDKEQP